MRYTREKRIKYTFVADNKLSQSHLKTLSRYGFHDILLLKIIYALAFARRAHCALLFRLIAVRES